MRKNLFVIASLLIVASMVLGACATPTPEKIIETVTVETVKTVEVVTEGQTVVVTATPEPVMAAEFKSADPATYITVTFGDPDTLDPALDYETAGGGVIQNVYDTLIYFQQENPNAFVPVLALEVPSVENGGISADGLVYTFKVREGVKFHNGADLTASDIAYSIQRGVLLGGYNSPQWLFTEPFLGVGVSDIGELVNPDVAGDPAGMLAEDPAKLLEACEKVTAAIVADDAAGTVVFTLVQPWAPFLATLAQQWGAALDKDWAIESGAWDGDCATWQNFYAKSAEELNALPLGSSANGTGPYKLDRWVQGEEIVLTANEDYWLTEPLWEGGPTGAPAIKTIIIKNVTEFSTRYAMLQAGDADTVTVGSSADWPQMDMLTGQVCQLTDQDCEPTETPDGQLELIRGYATGNRTDIFMNYAVNMEGGNNFVGSGALDGNGIPADFFSNVHVRKAFAYCFNYDAYLNDVLLGEGTRSLAVMLPGQPGYREDTPIYEYDPAKCEEELKAAEFDGKSQSGTPVSASLWLTTPETPLARPSARSCRPSSPL